MGEQDNARKLLDLAAVHGFDIAALEEFLGHTIPLPRDTMEPDSSADRIQHSIDTLTRWLDVLDMAITPPMIRSAMSQIGHEVGEALIRYFVEKKSGQDIDRDKTDCIITYLCRNPRPDGRTSPESNEHINEIYQAAADAALEFEADLYRILQDTTVPHLEDQHVQLLKEFEFLYHEVQEFRSFDQLMDSGILGKVKDLKKAFGESFYHPDVLSTVAIYNVVFGRKFDALFHEASLQIKSFAERVQKEGGSLLNRVEGDITVKNLTEVEEDKILEQDYTGAKEEFRKVSNFKKVVDQRKVGRIQPPGAVPQGAPNAAPAMAAPPVAAMAPPSGMPGTREVAPSVAAQQSQARKEEVEVLAVSASAMMDNVMEESKLRNIQDQIKNFIKAADPKGSYIVPLSIGTIPLSAAEAEAFRAEYGTERSFRADLAQSLIGLNIVGARMIQELEEFHRKENSAYLWKPHADSLTYLINKAAKIMAIADQVAEVAQQRGLTEKQMAVRGALQRMRAQIAQITATLQQINPSKKTAY